MSRSISGFTLWELLATIFCAFVVVVIVASLIENVVVGNTCFGDTNKQCKVLEYDPSDCRDYICNTCETFYNCR